MPLTVYPTNISIKKMSSLKHQIMSLEMPRMQDFTPFTPELLGVLIGPQTPGRIDTSLCEVWKSLCDFTYSSRASFRVGISAIG